MHIRPILIASLASLPFMGLNTAFAASEVSPTASVAAPAVVLDQIVVSGEQPGPGLWKVTKGDHTLWILGTQTPVLQKMTWRSKGLEAVIAQSTEILSEPSAGVSAKQIGYFTMLTLLPSALQLRKNPDNATLKDLVPADLHARWLILRDKYIDSYTINDEEKNIESWRPMFVALELYNKAINKSGLTTASPVWPVIRAAASKHKVKITQVRYEPTVSDPRGALKELRSTRLADVDCFAKTVERIETDLASMRVRANAWATGDINAIRSLPIKDQRAACEAAIQKASFMKTLGTQDLLSQIENMWLNAAEAAIKNNKVALAVLPIGRIVSADGYVAKLRARGYSVEEPE